MSLTPLIHRVFFPQVQKLLFRRQRGDVLSEVALRSASWRNMVAFRSVSIVHETFGAWH